jgi:hypothetical protein
LIQVQHLPENHAKSQSKPNKTKQAKTNAAALRVILAASMIKDIFVRLVGQVITVSVETVQLVNALAQAVKVEDWLGDAVETKE